MGLRLAGNGVPSNYGHRLPQRVVTLENTIRPAITQISEQQTGNVRSANEIKDQLNRICVELAEIKESIAKIQYYTPYISQPRYYWYW
jgi:hypothetical protein